MDKPRPTHLLDTTRPHVRGVGFGVCGARVRSNYLTTMGWKVTCEVCNPPVRRRVRVVKRPSPAAPTLEDA